MTISQELVQRLVCPETRRPLSLADGPLLAQLNALIAAGKLRNAAGQTVERRLEGGLVRDDRAVLYPISDDIPVLLTDEAIALDQLTAASQQP